MRFARGLVPAVVLVVACSVVFLLIRGGESDGGSIKEAAGAGVPAERRSTEADTRSEATASPFDVDIEVVVSAENASPTADDAPTAPLTARTSDADASSAPVSSDASAADVPIDRLGRDSMSDEFQAELGAALRGDPAKLLALIDSLRADGDAERIRRLSIVLGELGAPAVDALVEELAYSSDPALVVAALDLMKRSGVDGARARAVVSTLLGNSSAPEVLVPALSAIARPGGASDAERQDMAGQIVLLTNHDSASVRRASVDLLSRWTSDGSDTPVLVSALRDEDASVRRSAAYSLVGHEHNTEDVLAGLLRTIEDPAEDKRVRLAAILAVQRNPGTDETQRQRVEEVLLLLNRRPARQD